MASTQETPSAPSSSSQPLSQTRTSPETIQSPKDEIDAITSSLAARRRRRSLGSILRASKRPPSPKGKGKGRGTGPDGQILEDDEDSEEDLEHRDEEGTRRVKTAEIDAYDESKGKPIKILRRSGVHMNGSDEAGEVFNPEEECVIEMKPEYVWDVLFENQRGLYLLGKGYFSSRSLLPADPSPFTRPSTDLFSASSFSIADGSGHKRTQRAKPNSDDPQDPFARLDSQPQDRSPSPSQSQSISPNSAPGKGVGAPRPKSNKTSYTLETYQTPLPDWQYLTPWMINMRVGTDEGGWRYNAWFKKKGWSSHAGPVGWGGWVRRREWVRLRYVVLEPKAEEVLVDITDRDQIESKAKTLDEVLSSESVTENVQNLLKAMGREGLDRQRLELWAKWLDREKKGSEAWHRLKAVCEDEQSLNDLKRQFTYSTNFPSFLSLLASNSVTVHPSFVSRPSSSPPSTPSTPVSPGGDRRDPLDQSAKHYSKSVPQDGS